MPLLQQGYVRLFRDLHGQAHDQMRVVGPSLHLHRQVPWEALQAYAFMIINMTGAGGGDDSEEAFIAYFGDNSASNLEKYITYDGGVTSIYNTTLNGLYVQAGPTGNVTNIHNQPFQIIRRSSGSVGSGGYYNEPSMRSQSYPVGSNGKNFYKNVSYSVKSGKNLSDLLQISYNSIGDLTIRIYIIPLINSACWILSSSTLSGDIDSHITYIDYTISGYTILNSELHSPILPLIESTTVYIAGATKVS